jgi:hypothetical protein
VAFIVAHARSTDVIVDTTNHGVGTTVYYYLVSDQRAGLGILGSDQITRFADAGHRLWLLSPAFAMSPYAVSEFRRLGLRIEAHQSYTSGQPLSVTLASRLGSSR